MKIYCKLLLTFILGLILNISIGQIQGITENGDEVTLYEDGTWEYVGEEPAPKIIPMSKDTFVKPSSSTFLMKSKKTSFGYHVNPKSWIIEKAKQHPDAEYQLRFKDNDIYGMIITEKVEIPVETLRNIVLDNAKQGASEVKVIEEEYRMVNGLKVLYMVFEAKTQGIQFRYKGYYYSDESGTMQFLLFSSPKIVKKLNEDIENVLNGFVTLEKKDK